MKNIKEKMNNKGFTLMELIIVVAILAILIALIAPNLVGFIDKASDTADQGNAKSIYTAGAAWATQERVDGRKVSGTASIANKSTTPSISTTGADTAALIEAVNAGVLADGATAQMVFVGGKCVAVRYSQDGTTAGYVYYPSTAEDDNTITWPTQSSN